MTYWTFASALLSTVAWLATSVAFAQDFNIPAGSLKSVLDAYARQTGVELAVSGSTVSTMRSRGLKGAFSPDEALSHILSGTGLVPRREDSAIAIVPDRQSSEELLLQFAQASPPRSAVETVTVTSSKLGGADVQSIPISITALSQEQLTATQTAGGPDLVKQVPNLTFTKTNFTGYSIQIRGIGTQAISVTTDPAVAVSFNDIPFIRNHFFEQEFYDVSQVEVLRGPQGTLYGRNATAGVVNLVSAKPTDQFEAMASGEIGNYHQRRFEGMINLPIVDDRLDIRVAGEWTKRQGYSFNETTGQRIDGRDLWSGRLTIGLKPLPNLQAYLVWEHFSEDDDRIRSSKQLCKTSPIPTTIGGQSTGDTSRGDSYYLSQGCLPASLYASDAFEVPNGFSLPYFGGLIGAGLGGAINTPLIKMDPYISTTQSTNLRVIQSTLNPIYKAKNDVVELNVDYQVMPQLTITSQTSFNQDFLYSAEDYNRFNTTPGIFLYDPGNFGDLITPDGYFCDPQLGCANKLVAEDLSDEHAWQLGQEFRLSSNFTGPLNFSLGGNYLHYETEENYHVFINTLTMFMVNQTVPWIPGVSDNHQSLPAGFSYNNPARGGDVFEVQNGYIDPNTIDRLNNNGHNYFLSENPYVLNSYAMFGEANYAITPELKVIGGLRWTEDQKHFVDIPSELLLPGWGYASIGTVDQQWDQFSGRAVVNWTPKLPFTDQTLVYGSYSHGYKAGGANPPGAVLLTTSLTGAPTSAQPANPIHPLTFKPEFVDAFELGTKNTLLDGALTFNGSAFYYNYENYQISEIVDRSAINLNFDAHVKGAEVEATWEPTPGLRFNFGGGWEDTSLAKGSKAVDLIDRTAGTPGWIVLKPFPTQASNCIIPLYVVTARSADNTGTWATLAEACGVAYNGHLDPVTRLSYKENPTVDNQGTSLAGYVPGYVGFDPLSVDPNAPAGVNNGLGLPPNNGQGFDKDLSGKELPNAPPFTVSAGAQYSIPLTTDWAGTLRADYYWQDYSWARVFNDNPYDRLRGYTNVNLTLIFTSQNGWQVMLYDKNIFNTTAITGAFLNSDDSGLTTNVFLTDPKLIGIRVTKNW